MELLHKGWSYSLCCEAQCVRRGGTREQDVNLHTLASSPATDAQEQDYRLPAWEAKDRIPLGRLNAAARLIGES